MNVLETLIHDQPAAIRARLRCADELAVLRLPVGVADDVPTREGGALHHAVRFEIARPGGVETPCHHGDGNS
jgi:hypothetical protein